MKPGSTAFLFQGLWWTLARELALLPRKTANIATSGGCGAEPSSTIQEQPMINDQ
jgi:hypothetical protein